jgi:hypothetical protein
VSTVWKTNYKPSRKEDLFVEISFPNLVFGNSLSLILFFFLVGYSTSVSVAKAEQRRMEGSLMNDRFGMIWKEVIKE